jgi:predicted RNA-binding Zn-ribbon protein involved in translation (DUF1610 family)
VLAQPECWVFGWAPFCTVQASFPASVGGAGGSVVPRAARASGPGDSRSIRTSPSLEEMSAMRNLIAGLQSSSCPKCGSVYLVRSHRKGLEQLVSACGIFPYRCDACGHRFSLFGESRERPMDDGLPAAAGKEL